LGVVSGPSMRRACPSLGQNRLKPWPAPTQENLVFDYTREQMNQQSALIIVKIEGRRCDSC